MTKKYSLTREEAIRELARRKGLIAEAGTFRLEDYLFDKQLTFVNDPSPFKIAVTTRRAGKTISCVADLAHTALATPDVVVLYVTLSRQNAKRLVWPEFKKLDAKFKLGAEVNESDLSMKFPNGSRLYVLGANDRPSIENFRGLPIKKVYLDESQSFPPYIRELIDEVISPALMDYNGQLILIGTPGLLPSGYFYELTLNSEWSQHHWSFFDNPKLPFLQMGLTHHDMLNRELKRRGVGADDPAIQREWFGKWVADENSRVFKYDAIRNDYTLLPSTAWTYILGVDFGFDDADALAVVAYSPLFPETYLVEEVVTRGQDISALCSQIDTLVAKYDFEKIVVDTGGLGKKIAEEIRKRWTIPLIAAEKQRKHEYIELMNDAMRTGRFKIKSQSQFAQDAMRVEWDHDRSTPDKLVVSDRFHSDICDAVLYAWRESYAFAHQPTPAVPEFGTPAWANAQSEAMFNHEVDKFTEIEAQISEWSGEESEMDVNVEDIQVLDRPKGRYELKFKERMNKKLK